MGIYSFFFLEYMGYFLGEVRRSKGGGEGIFGFECKFFSEGCVILGKLFWWFWFRFVCSGDNVVLDRVESMVRDVVRYLVRVWYLEVFNLFLLVFCFSFDFDFNYF